MKLLNLVIVEALAQIDSVLRPDANEITAERGKKPTYNDADFIYPVDNKPIKKPTKKPTKKPIKKPLQAAPEPTDNPYGFDYVVAADGYPGGNGGAGNASGAYGDPHFHILGRSDAQPDLCFDYNPESGEEIKIIEDLETGLYVNGTVFQPNPSIDEIYFESVTITSPHGSKLTVDADMWDVETILPNHSPSYDWSTETLKYADFVFGQFQKKGTGNNGVKTIQVNLPSIGSFQIERYTKHNNVNLKVIDYKPNGSVSGVLGNFLPVGSYQVQKFDENKGQLIWNGKTMPVIRRRHAWNKNCWTLSNRDFVLLTLAKFML